MIELKIAKAIRDYALKDDIIEWIADSCVEDHDRRVSESHLSVFEDQLAEVNRSIKNVMSAIEKGIITETTKGRLMELEAERTAIEGKICAAKAAIVPTNRERLVEWLRSLREGDVHDKKYQAGLFDTFLVAAYLYDDNRVKIVFSFAGDKNTIEIPLEDVIDSIDDEASCVRLSSTLSHQKVRYPMDTGLFCTILLYLLFWKVRFALQRIARSRSESFRLPVLAICIIKGKQSL